MKNEIIEISDKLRLKLQNQLIDLICRILVKNENLHYYQVNKAYKYKLIVLKIFKSINYSSKGYHDICLTFLLVVGV